MPGDGVPEPLGGGYAVCHHRTAHSTPSRTRGQGRPRTFRKNRNVGLLLLLLQVELLFADVDFALRRSVELD